MLAALILIGGSLGDKLGRKKIFMWGIFIFISGSVACGFAPDVNLLTFFRMLQGVGGALMIPGSLSLISSSINVNERGKAIGTWSAFTTVVTMGGPALGGAFADAGLWRYIFFINIPIGVIAIFILWRFVNESRDENKDHKIDYPGAMAIAAGLMLVTFGFLRLPALSFNNWQVYGSLSSGILLLLLFVFIEAKSKHPMMPLQLFKSSTFSGTNLLTFFLYAGLGAGMLFLSLNMVQVQGYTQLQSGLTFLPFTVMMMIISRIAGKLSDKRGPRLLLIAGPVVAGAGLLMLSLIKQTSGASQYWTTFFPGILVLGLGMSFTVTPLTTAVMGSVTDHLSGTASGVNNAVSRIAGVFANAIFGALAILFFSGALQRQLKPLQFSASNNQAIMMQAVNMGNARVPKNISAGERPKVETAYRNSFIFAYSTVLKIAAMLAFSGGLTAFVFIKNTQQSKKSEEKFPPRG